MSPEEMLQQARVFRLAPKKREQLSPDQVPAYSDEALALSFAEHHAKDMRFLAARGKWLFWAGTHWEFDDTLGYYDKARAVCREAVVKCSKPRVASIIASAKTVAAVERLAKADRRLAATIDQWDGQPDIFNTPTKDVVR
jgi:putative DNA primase/helicase